MTREEARQKAEIMLAYANGKEIEFYNDEDKTWASINDPSFDNCVDYYRVKKESKYRPFKDGDECFKEMKKHEPFGWVRSKESGKYFYPICYSDTEAMMTSSCRNTYDEMIEGFTFLDGSPFGIKEEE